jgi:DNA-directed RNA polymerase subunit M/transcription elongation factor TFIIS
MDKVCQKCNSIAKPSKTYLNTLVVFKDFHDDNDGDIVGDIVGRTQSRHGSAILVDCLKCDNCGHSWIPDLDEDDC